MKKIFIIYCLLLLPWGSISFGQKLSPVQQMVDFDTLCAKLECVHPDLYLYQSKKRV